MSSFTVQRPFRVFSFKRTHSTRSPVLGNGGLLKLLMSFYAPTEGRVLIDGMDLRDFELASLRERIGLVSQDPFIFSGTLRENIA